MASRSELQSARGASIGEVVIGEDGFPYEAKLVQVNISSRTDNYYNMKLLKSNSTSGYHIYSESGRTGVDGVILNLPIPSESEAIEEFDKLYTERTGNSWAGRIIGSEPTSPDLYQHLSTVSRDLPRTEVARWEYYLKDDHHLNGAKPDGWYAYDKASGEEVEELYLDGQDNGSLTTRFVHSTSSGYTYRVNLNTFQQTNTTSNKTRPIRRICGTTITTKGSGTSSGSGRDMQKREIAIAKTSSSAVVKKKKTSKVKTSSSSSEGSPKKKSKVQKQSQVQQEVVTVMPPPPPTMTLNLRQQYVKGLLSDRSARKYLKSLGRKED